MMIIVMKHLVFLVIRFTGIYIIQTRLLQSSFQCSHSENKGKTMIRNAYDQRQENLSGSIWEKITRIDELKGCWAGKHFWIGNRVN